MKIVNSREKELKAKVSELSIWCFHLVSLCNLLFYDDSQISSKQFSGLEKAHSSVWNNAALSSNVMKCVLEIYAVIIGVRYISFHLYFH